MDGHSPEGTVRQRAAVGVWVALTIAFVALLIFGLVAWARGQSQPPLLAAIGGVGSLVSIWRWIAERTRANGG